jgi:hypothetical protein
VSVQRVGLTVNGHFVREWVASSRRAETYTAQIPGNLLPDPELLIELDLPDATSPSSIGEGGDPRELAIAMLSFELEPVEE